MEEKNEEVKKKKKIEISLGMAIFLFALFLVVIAGVIIGAILISKNKDKTAEKEQIIKVNAKGIVYTDFEEKGEEYSYSIPKINIDSKDVEDINDEIEEKIIKEVKKQIKEFKKWKKENNNENVSFSFEPCNISYNYYINGEILSVVIKFGFPYEYIEYTVYNVNIKTGEKFTNGEILGYKGISSEDFANKLPEIYGKCFEDVYKDSWYGADGYQEQYEATISKDNCDINQPIFLDENGKLNLIAKIHSMVGASYYYHIIKIEDSQFIEEQEIEEKEKESEDKEEKKDDKLVEQAKDAAEKTEEAMKKEQQLLEDVKQNIQPEMQEEVITFDEHYVVNMFVSYPSDWEIIDCGGYTDIKRKDSYNSYISIYKEQYSPINVDLVELYDESLCPEYTTIREHRWVVFYPSYPYNKLDRTMIACKNNWIYKVNVVVGDEADLDMINKILNSMGLLDG